MNLRKRWLAIAMTLFMTASLAPTGVFAASGGSSSGTAATAETQSAISAETYSELGLSRDVSGEDLMNEQQPYGKAEAGSTVAINVINELYVNFNGSIHYGWSILDDIPMKYRNGDAVENWTHDSNSYGAMGYWRPNQNTVKFKNGAKDVGALYADGSNDYNEPKKENMKILGDNINSSNYHLTNQYNLAEAFSPGTGKDNYVAQLRVNYNNDVYLEIYSVSEKSDGKYDNKCVASTKIGNNSEYSGTKDDTRIWNFEYDAMYELAAGDMDGDGYDEIAAYFGNIIYIYGYKGGSLGEICELELPPPEGISGDGDNKKLKSSIVTFAFGDFNADGKEELAAAQSMTYGATNHNEAKVNIYKLGDGGTLEVVEGLTDGVSLYQSEESSSMVIGYANVAAGDIDNDNIDELVIAGYGYYSTTIMGGVVVGNILSDQIYYKVIDIVDNDSNSGTDWEHTKFEKKDILGRIADNTGQLVTPVSLACAATQGVGYAEQIFMSGCLYSFNPTDGQLTLLTQMTTNREYKKDNGGKNNKSEIYVLNTVTGNFNGNAYGQEQIICVFAMKSDNSDNYWFDIAYINKDQPGDTDAEGTKGYWYGQEQVMNQEGSYNYKTDKTRASLYLSLAAVDCDDDSTLMQYEGCGVSYTNPEVYTVLQSAPYFEDLEENIGYLNQSETSYGIETSTGQYATAGGSLSAGMYMSYEQDISVFGVKIASIEAEVQYTNSFSYDFEYEKQVSEEISYNASAGDDYAVVYTVPYMNYNYKVWVPESEVPSDLDKFLSESYEGYNQLSASEKQALKNKIQGKDKIGGYWDDCTISIPMQPRTVILTVDMYDEVASVTSGLEPIRGNILKSEAGKPETYIHYSEYGSDNFSAILGDKWQSVTEAEGANTTITGANTTETKHSFTYSYEMEGKVGAGAGGATVGVVAGFGFGAGGGMSESSSKSYSATVDNIPATGKGYTFDWKFGTREAKLNGNSVLILEFRTQNVKCPPSPPKNIHVESVTMDSISLGWDAVPGAVNYEIYQMDVNGTDEFLMATIPGEATSYTDNSVQPNSSYIYSLVSVMKAGQKSIYSKNIPAKTLSEQMKDFYIIEQPEDAETYSGGDAVFELKAKYVNLKGEDEYSNVKYQWEKYNDTEREWEKVGIYSSVDGISRCVHESVDKYTDGTKYRCKVYINAGLYIYSTEAKVKLGRASSTTALSAKNGSVNLNNEDSVKTPYTVSKITQSSAKVPVTVTDGSKEYTEYIIYTVKENDEKDIEYYVYKDSTGAYYISGNAIKVTDSTSSTLQKCTPVSENETVSFYTDEQIYISWKDVTKNTTTGTISFSVSDNEEDSSVQFAANDDYTYKASAKYDFSKDGTTGSLYECVGANADDKAWFAVVGNTAYMADVQTKQVVKINEQTSIDLGMLEMNEQEVKIEVVSQKSEEGDTLTLKASVVQKGLLPNSDSQKKPTKSVIFSIRNTDGSISENISAKIDANGEASCEWKPSIAGVYIVKAVYEGDECLKGSSSESMIINVVTPNMKKLALSGDNMTYGDSQNLSLVLFDQTADDNGTLSGEIKTLNSTEASITEIKVDNVASSLNAVQYSGEVIKFTPDRAGIYTITASYKYGESDSDVITVSKSIKVEKRNLIIKPKDIETPLGTSEELTLDDTLFEGISEADKTAVKSVIQLSCSDNGNQAAANGVFTISSSLKEGVDASGVLNKYNLVFYTGTCIVSADTCLVYNDTKDANGTVKLTYSVDGMSSVECGSGSVVPKGAKLTIVGNPAYGYKVDKWYVAEENGDFEEVVLTSSNNNIYYQNNNLIIKNIDKTYHVKAEFGAIYYKLNFNVQGGKDNGTITAKYVNDSGTEGSTFSSGNNMSPSQHKIKLKAEPASGKTITKWIVYDKVNPEGMAVKAENGTDYYTSDTYIVSSISSDTTITVVTEDTEKKNISVTLVDGDGNALSTEYINVLFNEVSVKAENQSFKYETEKHANVTIDLNIPDSLIVDMWSKKTGETFDFVSDGLTNNKKTYVISDLQEDLDLVVKCISPNMCGVTYSSEWIGGGTDGIENAGTVKVYRNNTSESNLIASGSEVMQATVLYVLVEPVSGYDFVDLLVNDVSRLVDAKNVVGSDTAKMFVSEGVGGDISIKAVFAKRPVITLNADGLLDGASGFVTAEVDGKPVASSGTVAYNSKNDIVITAVAPEGYEVTGFIVGALPEEDGTPNNNDNNRTYTVSGKDGIKKDVTVTAVFRKLNVYDITYSVIDVNGEEEGGINGEISLSASRKGYDDSIVEDTGTKCKIYEGSAVTVKISPAPGYCLQHLLVDGNKKDVSGNVYKFEDLKNSYEIEAQFEAIGNKIYFSAKNSEDSKGKISAVYKTDEDSEEKTFESGSSLYTGSITFTAEPDDGYRVAGWYVNNVLQTGEGGEVITDSKFVYAPDSEDTGAVIVVKFEKSHYSIKFDIANIGGSDDDELWGTVKASKKAIADGDSVDAVNGNDFTFTVTPDSDHMIDYVKIDGVEFTEASDSLKSAEITIPKVAALASVEVRFAEIPSYTVTVGVEGNGSVICGIDKISTNGVKAIDVKYGESITLKAEASEYNTLLGWKQEGSDGYVSKDEKYTFKPSSAITLTAVFGEEAAYSAGYINPDDGILRMTIDNTPYTGAVVDGKCENNNVAEGSKIVFTAVPDPEPNKKTSVYDWYINGQSVCGYSNIAVASVVAKSSNTSKKVIDDVEYEITDTGKTLTILSLEKNVEVGVVFWESEPYDITYVDGTDTNAVQKAERWSTATITVGNGYTFNASKLAEAVGDNAEYTVTKNSDGSVTMEFKNIIGDIDTTSAFTKKPASIGGGGGGGGAVASDEYTVKFVTGWFTKPADQKVAQGKKVTEPKLEDHGNYTLEGWYSDAEYTKLYSFNSAVKSDMTLYAKWKLNIGSEDEHACAAFADIAEHWAKDYICFAVESGLMNGVGEDRFAPDSLLSRGMLVTVLYRADGSPEIADSQQAAGFADVEDGKWYADAVAWASANGIVTGYTSADGSQQLFGPDNSITREQFAAIMYRYAKYKGCDIAEGGTEAQKYSDYGEISSYAKSAVEWAVSTGLITGVSDTRLAPQGSATRAQTAAILQRFAEKIM